MSSSADVKLAPGAPEAKPPRASATVMLLREAAGDIEVLMTRRHENLAFMGGLWVFPGGVLHPADPSSQALARIPAPARTPTQRFATLQGQTLSATESLSLAVAACRETFEETGVLLAVDSGDQPCPAATLSRLQTERMAVVAQPEHFAMLLEREQLWLDVQRLVYWAHWITPSTASRRFDTRFFAVAAGAGQTVIADAAETMECRWMNPTSIIDLADRGAMAVSPPTLCNVLDLRESYGRHGSLNTLLAAEARRAVSTILPKMINEESQTTIVMPWDAEYASLAGESAPAHIEYPPFLRAQLPRLTVRRR